MYPRGPDDDLGLFSHFPNMTSILLLFVVGIAASFVSGMLGGGSGLVLAPLQILLGIDPKLATTTTHFGFIGVSLGAMARFNRERDIRRQHGVPLTIISLLSGFLGPYLLLSVDPRAFQQIIGALVLLCIPLFLLKSNLGTNKIHASRAKLLSGYLSVFLILTLQVAFGAATGIMAVFVLVYFFGLSMIETSSALRLPNLVSSLVGLMMYARNGKVDYDYGLTLLVAMALGGYLGSHVAIEGGNRFVKQLFALFASVLAVILVLS